MEMIESVVRPLRSLQSQLLVPSEMRERRAAFVRCTRNENYNIIKSHQLEIATLAVVSSLDVLRDGDETPVGWTEFAVNEAALLSSIGIPRTAMEHHIDNLN